MEPLAFSPPDKLFSAENSISLFPSSTSSAAPPIILWRRIETRNYFILAYAFIYIYMLYYYSTQQCVPWPWRTAINLPSWSADDLVLTLFWTVAAQQQQLKIRWAISSLMKCAPHANINFWDHLSFLEIFWCSIHRMFNIWFSFVQKVESQNHVVYNISHIPNNA